MSKLVIPTAEVFAPLLVPARYKGAHGGRGSGKSWFFAGSAVERCIWKPGTRIVCIREVQRSLKESVKRLIEDTIIKFAVGRYFQVREDRIDTQGDGIILFQGMQDHTAESIKSLEAFHVAYVEEAQTLTGRSLEMLRPTIRAPGSELWFSWNPRNRRDPVDAFLRGKARPPGAVVVEASYRTNPWFPPELEAERIHDQATNPDRYGHIWEGEYEPAALGAYYASQMADADRTGRICQVEHTPGAKVEAWFDLGVSDPTAIWFVQRVGLEMHVIDYFEQAGCSLADLAYVLQEKAQAGKWVWGDIVWPHDGAHPQKATGKPLSDTFAELGFRPVILGPDEVGPGIDQVRLALPKCWFDAVKCEKGLDALRNYRTEWDDTKLTFKPKPLHDWASHGADAFRYGIMHTPTGDWGKPIDYSHMPRVI